MALIELHFHVIEDSNMSDALNRLTASVDANTSATASVIALLGTLSQEIRDNATDPAALNALADKIDADNASIAAAVTANTPAAPAPTEPTPAPVDGSQPAA